MGVPSRTSAPTLALIRTAWASDHPSRRYAPPEAHPQVLIIALLYGTASALVFGQLFFPSVSPAAGTIAAFATFAITFAARPIGAALFGHFGDRIGRKNMLVLSMLMMGVGTFLIGLLPTYQTIGIWAPICLVLLRIVQGFAVGGEYGGATTMAMEYAPPHRRGFYTTWPQMGNPLGLLLGTSMIYLFALLPEDQFLSWGWRVPFLFSAVLVAVGVYIRMRIEETPTFQHAREEQPQTRMPLLELARTYKRTLLLVILAPAALNVAFYIFSAWSISYMTTELKLSTTTALGVVMFAAGLDFIAQPFFGLLSDKIGRRPVYIGGSIVFGLLAFPFFWMVDTKSVVLIVIAMILAITIGHGSTYSTQAVFFAELFGTNVRYSGISIGYHVGAALMSGPGPFVAAALLSATGGTWGISLLMVVASVVSVIAIWRAGETYRKDIHA
ncbi:MAG: MFS transporter [Streptosporangiales bacterium]|nr:MFS transporter [Streptosporangiales bacterium]